MADTQAEREFFRERAEREIALAKAAGAQNAHASADYRTIFIRRRDGTEEKVRIETKQQPKN
jgi:hypothetical protein